MTETYYERLGETVYRTTLPNGLTVMVDRRRGFRKTFAFFATRYGGVDVRFSHQGVWHDTPAGVAHFLEHKLFDTKDGSALQRMAEQGANPNAFTSFTMTGYYFQCTEKFQENLRILLNFVTEPYFTPESVAKEQGIIGQEIAMGDDDADGEVFYDLLKCLYVHHPMRSHIAGTVESISAITAETLYLCHRAFYDPANMVLVVVGDVDPDEVARLARAGTPASTGDRPERDYGAPEPDGPARSSSRRSMEVAETLFALGFKLPAPVDGAEMFRLELLGNLTGDLLMGESSPLYGTLYETGLLNREFSYETSCGPGGAFFLAGGESRDPEAVRDAILAQAEQTLRQGVSDECFRRLKRAAYGGMVSGLNSFEHTAVELAQNHLFGVDYLFFPQVFESITPGDVEDFLRRYVVPQRAALAVITPGGEKT